MGYVFSNKGVAVLDTSFGTASTILVLSIGEGSKFPVTTPGDFFDVVFEDRRTGLYEICRCTSRTGDQLTLVRATQGTTARSWPAGTQLSHRVTAEFFEDIRDDLAQQAADSAAAFNALGTMADQNSNAVSISGGNIDGVPIGQTTKTLGTFTTLVADFGRITHDDDARFDLQTRDSPDTHERVRWRKNLTGYGWFTTNNTATVEYPDYFITVGVNGATQHMWYQNNAATMAHYNATLALIGDAPELQMRDTAGTPTTHSILAHNYNNSTYSQYVLTSTGAYVANVKDVAIGAFGAVTHRWFVGANQILLQAENGNFRFYSNGGQIFHITPSETTTTGLRPSSEGPYTVGSPVARYAAVWAVNGTIQTSDEREKQDIELLTAAERRVAQQLKLLVRTYRWKEELNRGSEKHFGFVAQQVIAAFEDEGLDWREYGVISGGADTLYGVNLPELNTFIIAAL